MKKLVCMFFLILSFVSLTETVIITKTGHCFHASENCRGLNRAKYLYKVDVTEAQAMGLRPCKFSYPGGYHKPKEKQQVSMSRKEIDRRLSSLGYTGKNAVREFQTDYGLVPDGKVGRNTIRVLKENTY